MRTGCCNYIIKKSVTNREQKNDKVRNDSKRVSYTCLLYTSSLDVQQVQTIVKVDQCTFAILTMVSLEPMVSLVVTDLSHVVQDSVLRCRIFPVSYTHLDVYKRQDGRPFHGPCAIRMNLALPMSRVQEAFDRLDKYVFAVK